MLKWAVHYSAFLIFFAGLFAISGGAQAQELVAPPLLLPPAAESSAPAAPTETPSTMATTSTSVSNPDEVVPPKVKASMYTLVWGRDINDTLYRSVSALTYLEPHVDFNYNAWLTFDLQVAGYFVTGNTQGFYTDEGKSSNGIYLEEAAANFKPFTGLEVHAGAVYVQMNPIQSIMSQNSFLGTTQNYSFKIDGTDVTLIAMADESVPSSGTVTKGQIDTAPDAFFLTQTFEIESKFSPISSTLKVATTHYEFGNLSANIASDSILIGNDPRSFEGIGTTTRYIIGFGGLETAADFQTDWNKTFSSDLTASVIQNTEAPSDRNFGTQASLAVTTKFEKYNLIPSVGVFDMGADVTPATYTILPFRYQDREGFTSMIKFELKREKLGFFVNYTRGNLILPNPYLANRDMYTVGVESKNDLF